MFENSMTIQNPFGTTVFGSALLKVTPDRAVITASVTRTEQKPSDAFSKAKEGARSVAQFLRRSQIEEFGTSRMSLGRDLRFVGGAQKLLGYKAVVGFAVKVKELELLEEIIAGVIEAGANEIASVQFQTSQLKELRIQARRLVIQSAKDKATDYTEAAGVVLGRIIHIQDVNPQQLQQLWRPQFHAGYRGSEESFSEQPADQVGMQTLDPGAIEVAAGVLVAFSLS